MIGFLFFKSKVRVVLARWKSDQSLFVAEVRVVPRIGGPGTGTVGGAAT